MLSISDAVREILSEDGLIIEASQRGVLNISAYANTIQAEVEAKTKKPVRLGTIAVALNRIIDTIKLHPPITPLIIIDSISITSSLCGITYDKTDLVIKDISQINHSYIDNANAFFAMTMGTKEVTMICTTALEHRITQTIGQRSKSTIADLVALSVRFSADYIDVPNTIYSLVGIFATRHLNIMEIVSTYTEVTFVLYEKELEAAIQSLQSYQAKKPQE